MGKEALDYVLVPLGLALMVGYHGLLLLRIRRRPATTVIGVNAINRRIWVRHVMEEATGKHAVLAVQTMRNNIMASTLLASTAITLSSLIAVLMSSGGCGSSPSSSSSSGLLPDAPLVVGATGAGALTAKFFAILVCFLVAFLLNVQSIRYYSHTSTLVNVPLLQEVGRRRRLRHRHAQPRQLLLVAGGQGLLLLVPGVSLALWPHPHVRSLCCHGLRALLPRCLR